MNLNFLFVKTNEVFRFSKSIKEFRFKTIKISTVYRDETRDSLQTGTVEPSFPRAFLASDGNFRYWNFVPLCRRTRRSSNGGQFNSVCRSCRGATSPWQRGPQDNSPNSADRADSEPDLARSPPAKQSKQKQKKNPPVNRWRPSWNFTRIFLIDFCTLELDAHGFGCWAR